MDIGSIDLYNMSKEREEAFFKDCLFVFDTSALLDFYLYPNKTKEDIFNEVFEKLVDRLWITSHTEYEYLKNRLKTFKKPIEEKYNPLRNDNLKKIEDSLKEAKNKLEDLKRRTSKDDIHPYLNQQHIDDYILKFEAIINENKVFKEGVSNQIEEQINEIKAIEADDIVLKAFDKHFKIGRKYYFRELIGLAREAELRYKFKIPPGHEDATEINKNNPTEKGKLGLQVFGDVFIWTQVIEIAGTEHKNIAFICNDIKIDWCYTDDSSGEKRIRAPREDLIREIIDETGQEFWMYTSQQFLYLAKKYLAANIDESQIAKVGKLTLFGVPQVEGTYKITALKSNPKVGGVYEDLLAAAPLILTTTCLNDIKITFETGGNITTDNPTTCQKSVVPPSAITGIDGSSKWTFNGNTLTIIRADNATTTYNVLKTGSVLQLQWQSEADYMGDGTKINYTYTMDLTRLY